MIIGLLIFYGICVAANTFVDVCIYMMLYKHRVTEQHYLSRESMLPIYNIACLTKSLREYFLYKQLLKGKKYNLGDTVYAWSNKYDAVITYKCVGYDISQYELRYMLYSTYSDHVCHHLNEMSSTIAVAKDYEDFLEQIKKQYDRSESLSNILNK